MLDNVVAFLSRDDLATLATVSRDYSCTAKKYAQDILIDKRWIQHRVGEVLEMPGSVSHDWRKTRAIAEECADALLLTGSAIDAYIARKLGATQWDDTDVFNKMGECAQYGHVNAFRTALQYYIPLNMLNDYCYLHFVAYALRGDSITILRLPEMRRFLARMTADEIEEVAQEISELSVSPRTVDFFLSSLSVDSLTVLESYGTEALEHGLLGLVRVYLRHGIIPSCYGQDAIAIAGNHGHADILRILLAHPNIIIPPEYRIDISNAVKDGYTEVVRLLVEDGRLNLRDTSYIAVAVQRGHAEIVAILLEHYAAHEGPHHYADLIKSAINNNRAEIVRMLLAVRNLASLLPRERGMMITFAEHNGNDVITQMLRSH